MSETDENAMSDSPATTVTATTSAPQPVIEAEQTDPVSSEQYGKIEVPDEMPAPIVTHDEETAREVAAEHLARLLYVPQSAWSRYVFHETDPYPQRGARRGEDRK